MKNKKGFTLAEVLVTMGVIGVVAALTVPNLVKDYQNKSLVAQLQKVYAELQQVFDNYLSDERVEDLKETDLFVFTSSATASNVTGLEAFLRQYFKSPAICNPASNCFASEYYFISGTKDESVTTALADTNFRGAALGSGAAIALRPGSYGYVCGDNGSNCRYIYVDVNGKRPPNIIGKDLFILWVADSGVVTARLTDTAARDTWFDTNCLKSGTPLVGADCFGKILNDNWEMNY